jgi:hypothetical protein
MELAKDEMESNFTVEATDRDTVKVFSNDQVWQRKLEALGVVAYRVDGYGKFYKVSLADYNFGFTRKRQLTEAARAAMVERLRPATLHTTGTKAG